jgi:uncharacterized Zn-binding protein involved in type VI secretion
MEKHIIRLGDRTTTGGVVVTGSPMATDQGKPIARLGDKATCPRCKKGWGPIVTADPHMKIQGVPVARDGDIVDCGCSYGSNRLIGVSSASLLGETAGSNGSDDYSETAGGVAGNYKQGQGAGNGAVNETVATNGTVNGGIVTEIKRSAEESSTSPDEPGPLNALKGAGAAIASGASTVKNKFASLFSPGARMTEKLGKDAQKLINKSPTLKQQMNDLATKGWQIKWGKPGYGSSCNKKYKFITLDKNEQNNPTDIVQTLSHEAGHAEYSYKTDYSSKTAFVTQTLGDEGEATLNNIKVQREILASTQNATDIGIAGNYPKQYNAVYEQFLKDGNEVKARNAIGTIFGTNERVSIPPHLKYQDYYGNWYDTKTKHTP